MRLEKTVPLLVRGAATYAASQEARIDFTDVPTLPTPETVVRGIGLRFDGVWGSGGAGDTFDEDVLQRIFDSITLKVPGGHAYYDLPSQAGPNLRNLIWAMTGKRPPTSPNGSATGLGGGAVSSLSMTNALAFRIFAYLPFSSWGSLEQDDVNVPLRDLFGSQLRIGYPNASAVNGGIFDTGADNQGLSSGTLSAWIDLAGKDDYVAPSQFSVSQHDLSGIEENVNILNGRLAHWMIEVPTIADNVLTATRLTDANRDEVNFLFGGQPVVDRMDARQLVARWNWIHARSRDEELAHHETGLPFLPVFAPGRRDYKFTHSPLGGIDVKYRVTGTRTTPRVVIYSTKLNDGQSVQSRLAANKKRVHPDFLTSPDAFLSVKTKSKSSIDPGPQGAQRLPIKVNDEPVNAGE